MHKMETAKTRMAIVAKPLELESPSAKLTWHQEQASQISRCLPLPLGGNKTGRCFIHKLLKPAPVHDKCLEQVCVQVLLVT